MISPGLNEKSFRASFAKATRFMLLLLFRNSSIVPTRRIVLVEVSILYTGYPRITSRKGCNNRALMEHKKKSALFYRSYPAFIVDYSGQWESNFPFLDAIFPLISKTGKDLPGSTCEGSRVYHEDPSSSPFPSSLSKSTGKRKRSSPASQGTRCRKTPRTGHPSWRFPFPSWGHECSSAGFPPPAFLFLSFLLYIIFQEINRGYRPPECPPPRDSRSARCYPTDRVPGGYLAREEGARPGGQRLGYAAIRRSPHVLSGDRNCGIVRTI